jgi:hypothetical protein
MKIKKVVSFVEEKRTGTSITLVLLSNFNFGSARAFRKKIFGKLWKIFKEGKYEWLGGGHLIGSKYRGRVIYSDEQWISANPSVPDAKRVLAKITSELKKMMRNGVIVSGRAFITGTRRRIPIDYKPKSRDLIILTHHGRNVMHSVIRNLHSQRVEDKGVRKFLDLDYKKNGVLDVIYKKKRHLVVYKRGFLHCKDPRVIKKIIDWVKNVILKLKLN